jgi:hypothetical protein
MANHSLGSYTFEDNPETLTIPESKKTVSTVQTYAGSAVFQWPALIQGREIELFWTLMTVAQYEQLRALYVSEAAVTWDPQYLGTYEVIVTDLTGTYCAGVFDQKPYRFDVRMVLNIRSFTEAP